VPTPQTFSTASPRPGFTNPEKFPSLPARGRATPGPDPPGSSRSSVERLYNTSSSRTRLDPCSPRARHLAVLTHPGFVGAAPTLTDTSRLRLPPASTDCCDSPQMQVFHLHSNSSASRRTKPALNAFAITFPGRTHKMITDQIRSTVYLIDPKRPNRSPISTQPRSRRVPQCRHAL
jgi:hypothetical protein